MSLLSQYLLCNASFQSETSCQNDHAEESKKAARKKSPSSGRRIAHSIKLKETNKKVVTVLKKILLTAIFP